MQSAPVTPDEQDRLKALYDYDVLDTEAEKVFDDLTQLASEICDTPIALISLVDPDRQWFKSKVGLDAQETSRDIAFCAHAIHERQVFEVSDTLKDKRFFDNPLVTDQPNIRFYAGAQLVTPNGKAIGTLCAISDQPKVLNSQQKSALQILSREVISQLELRKSMKKLKAADERKSDYLSNLSHELRTPLNAIVSYSQLLMDDIDQLNLPDKYVEYIQHLDFSGKRLLALVNSVLDMSKIEEGKMDVVRSSIDVSAFARSLYGLMSVKAKEKSLHLNLQLDASLPQQVMLDESKVGQVVLNLISNAIKFTPPGKQVNVSFAYRNSNLTIEVADQGVGISQEDQQRLFKKFQQVGQTDQHEGSGLGLMICKGLAELMNGQLKLVSTPNVGTRVVVTLPAPPGESVNASHSLADTALRFDDDMRILLVEDNAINQSVAQAVFESIGLQIDLCDSGEDAVDQVRVQDYDLVFMDLHLPGINGYEAAALIHSKHPALPIVALSADAFAEQQTQDSQSHMRAFLSKPIDKNALINTLNAVSPTQ